MGNAIYKIIEIVGTSGTSIDNAIKSAIEHASNTISHLDWFKVLEMRGSITDQKISQFQVVVQVGFKIETHNKKDSYNKVAQDASKNYEQPVDPAIVNAV